MRKYDPYEQAVLLVGEIPKSQRREVFEQTIHVPPQQQG
jgi:hypothetical protein